MKQLRAYTREGAALLENSCFSRIINLVLPDPALFQLRSGKSAASWHACLQIRHVQRRTCAERAVEVQRLLDSWQQQRAQQEVNAADRREAVAVATQQKRYVVGQASCSI